MNKRFPYEILDLDPETNKQLLKDFTGERTGFVQVGPKKYFFPSGYRQEAENYYNFQVRSNDIWIVTFPRSGTTWTQEMVWLLANNLDYKKAAEISLMERFPFFEFSSFVHPELKKQFLLENKNDLNNFNLVEKITEPAYKALNTINKNKRRFIKTHLPFTLLPQNLLKSKVIYVARNPKDVAVSFYHLNRLFRTQGYSGDFPTYFDYFHRNLQPWTPYWSHLQEGWERRNQENFLFLFYENINKVDLNKSIKVVSEFLNQSYTDKEIKQLENHLKIENFRKNKSVNFDLLKQLGIILENEENFIRNGKNGNTNNYFKQDLNEQANKWIEENLENTDLRFPLF